MQRLGCVLNLFRFPAVLCGDCLPGPSTRYFCQLTVYTSFRKRSQKFPHRILRVIRRTIDEYESTWKDFLLPSFLVIVVLATRPFLERRSRSISLHDLLTKYIPSDKVERIELNPYIGSLAVLKSDAKMRLWRKILGWREVRKLEVLDIKKCEIDVRITDSITLQRTPEKWTPIMKTSGIKPQSVEWISISFIALYAAFVSRTLPAVKRKLAPWLKLEVIKPEKRWTQWTVSEECLPFVGLAGLHEAKAQVAEFIGYLKYPDRYKTLGATSLQKGALLIGPPGCGKTLLAKTAADESSLACIQVNGSSLTDSCKGRGAWKVKKLFNNARKMAPCIIYINGLDAFGQKCSGSEESFARVQTLIQLIFEMDHVGNNVALIASINRIDVLDKALLEHGRFERHIFINFPNAFERKELFSLFLGNIKLNHDPSHYMKRLVQLTSGLPAVAIKSIVNDALLKAGSDGRDYVTIRDIDLALQKALKRLTKEYGSEFLAYHECGHALMAYLLEYFDRSGKVSLLSRFDASDNSVEDIPRKYLTHEELNDQMCLLLGGAAAEYIIFGRISSKGRSDIKKAEERALVLVRSGMSERVGLLYFSDSESNEGDCVPRFSRKPFSLKVQNIIKQEVSRILKRASIKTEHILRRHRKQLKIMVGALLTNETLDYKDIVRLIGEPTKKTIKFHLKAGI